MKALTLRPQSGTLGRVSLALSDTLTEQEWEGIGDQLANLGRGLQWWIGDWCNFGQARYGEKYTRAAEITGLDVQTLMNIAWVCSRIDPSRRREHLSFSHHAEIASFEPTDQDRWLTEAEREKWSRNALRDAIRQERTADHPARQLPARIDEMSQRVAESVARIRDGLGLTQKALAEELYGTPTQQGAISRLETGKHRPQLATAQRLAVLAGVPLSEMGIEDAPVLPASVVQRAASAAIAALDRGDVEAVRGILERLASGGAGG